MKQKNLARLSQQYAAALREHLKPARAVPPDGTASALGRQAVALGLDTLGLARIHESALITLELSNRKNGAVKRAEKFFTETLNPIVETHHAARQSQTHLSRLRATLSQRTDELAASHRQLQRGVVRRKVMEQTAGKIGEHHQKCLEESLQLQKRLRQLTHRVLAAQEDERKNISRELQNEIAQTLLGINVRLLSLQQEAKNNSQGLKHKITSTHQLVANSAKSVRRVAREFGRL